MASQRILVLPLTIAAALFMENMDSTVIATSLPAIARDLGTDPVALKLAFTTYLLSLTVFIPISGWVADKFGGKNVFRAAIVIFMVGSIACGQSSSLESLIASRFLQGIGGAMMVPVGRLILLRETPKSQMVDALAWLTIPALIGPLIGPPIGGFITTYFSWRWIFWMNMPIGLLGLYVATRYMPNTFREEPKRLDWLGFLLSSLGLSALVFGSTVIGRDIISPVQTGALVLFGIVCLAFYIRHARRTVHPILDLELLKIHTFRVAVLGGSLFRIGVGAIPFLLPLMLQLGFNYSPVQSGLLTCSAALGSITMKAGASRLLRRFGFRTLLLTNGALAALTISANGLIVSSTPIGFMLALFALGGFLRSLQFTSLNALAYSDIDRPGASAATSFYSVAQQLSLSLGVTLAAVVLEVAQWVRGDVTLVARDFAIAFFVVGGISLLSLLTYLTLLERSGSAVLGKAEEPEV